MRCTDTASRKLRASGGIKRAKTLRSALFVLLPYWHVRPCPRGWWFSLGVHGLSALGPLVKTCVPEGVVACFLASAGMAITSSIATITRARLSTISMRFTIFHLLHLSHHPPNTFETQGTLRRMWFAGAGRVVYALAGAKQASGPLP